MALDPISVILKFGFLAVLYLFLIWVARSSLRDLARHEDGGVALESGSGVATDGRREASRDLRSGVDPQLVVVAAMGHDPGASFRIGESATIGRAPSSDIPIDDPFASSAHARVFPRGPFMYIEDMGSTNGTYHNGRQLRRPEQLKPADTVRIGDTEYRYQE